MIIDLSCSISNGTIVFSGHPEVLVKKVRTASGSTIDTLYMSSHTGTHIDAPAHFFQSGSSTDSIDLEKLIASTYILDYSTMIPGTPIGSEHLSVNEDCLLPGGSVFLNTGYNSSGKKGNFNTSYSALSIDGAKYLINKAVSVVGIDSPSIGPDSNEGIEVHKLLLSSNVIIIERLINLGKIRNQPVKTIALPLKLDKCTGAPCRVIAVED